jgi:hypothetical protein
MGPSPPSAMKKEKRETTCGLLEINHLRLVIGNWNPDCWGRIENDDRNSTMLIPMWREILTVGAGLGGRS